MTGDHVKTLNGKKSGKELKIRLDPAYLILFCYIMLIFSRFVMRGIGSGENEYLAVIIMQLLTFALPAAIWYRLRLLPGFSEGGTLKPTAKRLRLSPPRLSHITIMISSVFVLISGCLLLSIGMSQSSSLEGSFSLYDVFVSRYDGKPLGAIWLVLAYAALPAVCEEMVFRCFLCSEYDRYGVACSIIMNSLFFGFLHFNFMKLAVYLFAGAVLTVLLYATRSVFSVIIVHFAYNLFCIFGQPYITEFYITAGNTGTAVIILTAMLLGALVGFCGGARRLYAGYAESDPPSDSEPMTRGQFIKNLRACLLTPGTAICTALFLAFSIVMIFI